MQPVRRILIYIEPLFELSSPYFKQNWANSTARMLIDSLNGVSGRSYEFCVVVNDAMARRLVGFDAERVVTLQQHEMVEAAGEMDSVDMQVRWFQGAFSAAELAPCAALLGRKLGGFVPDLILTWSPTPFLSVLFPDAVTLHLEYAMFSIPPYPETFFFDPVGPGGTMFLNRFWDKIRAGSGLDDRSAALVSRFKQRCRDAMSQSTPFGPLIAEARANFPRLALLSLQFPGHFLFEAYSPIKCQFELLLQVLHRLPPDCGLLVTNHPLGKPFDADQLDYLRFKHKNFIYSPGFENCRAPSQYLAAETDAIITVSSKSGYQTLLFDNWLVNPGRGFLRFMADSDQVGQLPSLFPRERPNRDALLWWMLTRFAIPRDYLSNPDWLGSFFDRCVDRSRAGEVDAGYYDPIDSTEAIFEGLTGHLDAELNSAASSAKIEELVRATHRGDYETALQTLSPDFLNDFLPVLRQLEESRNGNLPLRAIRGYFMPRPGNALEGLLCLGIIALNHLREYEFAAAMFRAVFTVADPVAALKPANAPLIGGLRWFARLHEGIAERTGGNRAEASRVCESIAGWQGADGPPDDIRQRARQELMAAPAA